MSIRRRRRELRRRLRKFGFDGCKKHLALQKADFCSKGVLSDVSETNFDSTFAAIEKIVAENACLHLSDLEVKGKDLIELGFEAGPRLGQALETLLGLVVDGELPNERTILLEKAKELL